MVELFLEWLYTKVGIDTELLDDWYDQARRELKQADDDTLEAFTLWYELNITD